VTGMGAPGKLVRPSRWKSGPSKGRRPFVASVARPPATVVASVQCNCMGCGIEPRKIRHHRGRGFSFARRHHVRHRPQPRADRASAGLVHRASEDDRKPTNVSRAATRCKQTAISDLPCTRRVASTCRLASGVCSVVTFERVAVRRAGRSVRTGRSVPRSFRSS
jgi:hypothetical protein